MDFLLHTPNETRVSEILALQINSMFKKECDIRFVIYSAFILAGELITKQPKLPHILILHQIIIKYKAPRNVYF
jgi:hypothetical protein